MYEEIKAEIEWLKPKLQKVATPDLMEWKSATMTTSSVCSMLDELISFIESLPKPSEDLEKAAQEYGRDLIPLDQCDTRDIVNAFKEGAQWQKEQMMKEIPKWKPAARAYLGDRLPKIDHSLNRVVARDETGAHYLTMDDLYKLPKEDEK